MPSSQGDRRSYARRRQYGVFTAYLIAISAVLFGLLAALAWKLDPVGFSNVRLFVAEVTAPAARVVRGGTSAGSGVDDSLSAWWRAGSQNASLRAELAKARREIIRARGLEAENAQLRALLALTRGEVRPVAVARLLSTSATSTRRFGLLDAGHGDGVRPGQPVRSADGLIGRTLEVGPTVSRILLITDRQSVVPVRRARDGLAAIVTGRGDELLDVRPLNAASNPLKVGDVLLASGSGGLYQPRTPVGIVIRLTSDGGLARPFADPGMAEGLIVEPPSQGDVEAPPSASDTAPFSEATGSAASTAGEQ